MGHPLGGKTSVAIGVMLVLLGVPYASPELARYRIARAPWEPSIAQAEVPTAAPSGAATSAPSLTQGEATLKASQNEKTVTNALPDDTAKTPALDPKVLAKTKGSLAVEDPTGKALDAFYTNLAKTKAKEKGAITRILHYGDSVITSDYVSGQMRRKMQAEFGDAGHGFLLIANPWEWYFHNDVAHGASEGWGSSRITGPTAKDGMYGIGGVTFKGSPGMSAWFSTSEGKANTHGKNVSRFDIYYLETPEGGDVEAKFDGKVEKFSTKGDSKTSKIQSYDVPDGENKLQIRCLTGNPRLFGVALERDEPGVVYDALGANGARSELLQGMDAAHWGEQMALRKPSLVILQYGTNESEAPFFAKEAYEKALTAVVEKLKTAAPDASILIAATLDRAENTESGGMRTKPIIKKLVESQRNVAVATNVAFWDTWQAMGGDGSMAKWVGKGLAGGDLTHPTPAGAEVIGDLFYKSLTTGFEAWTSAHPQKK